ncbi:MAG: SGNH/GDSL hydrolase family protein [Candidatus Heimdallarchaeota archaeon]
MKPGIIALIVILVVVIFGAISLGIFYRITLNKLFSLPENNPYEFVNNSEHLEKKKKRIVFIGDSLTHANISISYIDMIKKKLGNENYEYINAGFNGDQTYHILQRLDSIIACEPDIITLLIGTNDSNVEYDSLHISKHAKKKMSLPRTPTKKWFIENYNVILTELMSKTKAKIAICSLPIAGEDTNHEACEKSIDYSKTIKELAVNYKVNYLPFNEKMKAYLEKNPSQTKYTFDDRLVEKAAYQHYLFGRDFDTISKKYGFQLLVDNIHLNTKGAEIIANLMLEFIQN